MNFPEFLPTLRDSRLEGWENSYSSLFLFGKERVWLTERKFPPPSAGLFETTLSEPETGPHPVLRLDCLAGFSPSRPRESCKVESAPIAPGERNFLSSGKFSKPAEGHGRGASGRPSGHGSAYSKRRRARPDERAKTLSLGESERRRGRCPRAGEEIFCLPQVYRENCHRRVQGNSFERSSPKFLLRKCAGPSQPARPRGAERPRFPPGPIGGRAKPERASERFLGGESRTVRAARAGAFRL